MTIGDLKNGLKELYIDIPQKEIFALFKVYDQDNNGFVNARQFANSFIHADQFKAEAMSTVDPQMASIRSRTLVTPLIPGPTPDIYKVSRTGRRRPGPSHRDLLYTPSQRPATDRGGRMQHQISSDPWFRRNQTRSEMMSKRKQFSRGAALQLSDRTQVHAPPASKRHFW